jgi:hypothetical protein
MSMLPKLLFFREANRGGETTMQQLTKALLQRFEKVGRQEDVQDSIVIAKFFNPTGVGTVTYLVPKPYFFTGYILLNCG